MRRFEPHKLLYHFVGCIQIKKIRMSAGNRIPTRFSPAEQMTDTAGATGSVRVASLMSLTIRARHRARPDQGLRCSRSCLVVLTEAMKGPNLPAPPSALCQLHEPRDVWTGTQC